MKDNARIKAEIRGRRAEKLAELWLKVKGYKILARRKKTPFGEIDIIARKGKILAIIEVKQRPILEQAKAALHNSDLSRIEEAAYYFLAKSGLDDLNIRFDGIYVTKIFGIIPHLKHQKDEWRGY